MHRHPKLITKKILYLGLRLPNELIGKAYHLPLIETVPISYDSIESIQAKSFFQKTSHLLITSQTSATLLKKWQNHFNLSNPKKLNILAIGQKTGSALLSLGYPKPIIAQKEQAEGLIPLLKKTQKDAFIFYPHSANSRPILSQFLTKNKYSYFDFPLYKTKSLLVNELPNIENFNEIHFTSPSTVDAFYENFKTLPSHVRPICIGQITQKHLTNTYNSL